ncbi:hypothetical protein KKF05_02025 [Patescibacteria group bacterium]|nr:hypothetical protein [Patescibacteria group bacterium]MBU1915651.1 hypothetical protein [Patescibacteria group bacterium]
MARKSCRRRAHCPDCEHVEEECLGCTDKVLAGQCSEPPERLRPRPRDAADPADVYHWSNPAVRRRLLNTIGSTVFRS